MPTGSSDMHNAGSLLSGDFIYGLNMRLKRVDPDEEHSGYVKLVFEDAQIGEQSISISAFQRITVHRGGSY